MVGFLVVAAEAQVNCPGDGGDCCEANGTPGCDNTTCCECLCVIDPYC